MKQALLIISLICSITSFCDDGPWTQKSNIPAEGRHRTTGFSIGNKGYIGLGHYNSGPNGNVTFADIWEFDPGTNSWTQKADYGGGSTYGAMAFTIDNYAYVGAHVYGSDMWRFDPIANVWVEMAAVPSASADQTAFAINGKGYFVNYSSFYEYDPITDAWTVKAAPPGTVGSWSKSFVAGEKAYVLAASNASFYEYKPLTDQWAYRGQFPGEAIGGWSTFEIDNKGYVVSGYISFLNPTSRQCWEYDPNLNQWNQLEELPGSTRRFSSSFSIGGKGYIGTGTNGTNMNDLWEFNPELALGSEELVKIEIVPYPNPSTEIITIENHSNYVSINIDIYSISGQHLSTYKEVNDKCILNKSELGSGNFIYFISAENSILSSGKITFL